MPEIGEIVGAGVGGRDVCVAAGATVTGNVAVTNTGVGMTGVEGVTSQPEEMNTITVRGKYLM